MASYEHAPRSFGIVAFATVLGVGFAWLAGSNGITHSGLTVFAICAALAFVINWLAFIPAAIAQTEKYYDLVGAITYISMLVAACALSTPLDIRAIVVAAMVAIWSLRLGTFLYNRIHGAFLVAWTLQAVWTIITAAAALVIISASIRVPLDMFFWVGSAVWLFGFAVEVIADRQKSAFRADPDNEGDFIDEGLWSWSQHPNYFGEIMLWTGIVIIAFPLLSGWSFLVFASPLFITLLLTKISGINMLDAAAKKRWGDDEAYQAYRARTSKLILWPPIH